MFEVTTTWNNEKLKVFVKNTLACACPEKVFEKIDVTKFPVAEPEKEVTRLVVGDTLLVYVMRTESLDEFVDIIESIGLAGKTDRDTNNYNRFRLVVSSFEDLAQQDKVSERFSKAFNTDEKMHIHFVHQELVEGL